MHPTLVSIATVATIATTTLLLAAAALPAAAQHAAHGHGSGTASAPAAKGDTPLVPGEVRRVNKERKTVTLRHGEIKHLDMGEMTMVFNVRDAALLNSLKAGDKVLFAAQKDSNGELIITAIEPAR